MSKPRWFYCALRSSVRFWNHVDKSGFCWIWKLGKDKDGYGKYHVHVDRKDGKQIQKHVRAHRLAYMLSNGYITDNLLVLHSCDNPACCNPKHLSVGTQLQNRQEAKLRHRVAIAERHGKSKCSTEQALKILQLKNSGRPVTWISEKLLLPKSLVYQVGKTSWLHLVKNRTET